jgi:phosphoserine phosphatase
VYRADALPLYEFHKTLSFWKGGALLQICAAGVQTMTIAKFSDKATRFLDSVLRLQPKFAAFDCDGTLWAGDAGEGFFRWGFERGLVSDEVIRRETARYADYRQGKVSEDDMCGEMVTMHEGLTEAEVERAAAEYFDAKVTPSIFPEMRELIRCLHENGCEIWAVSSTNEWVIRDAMTHFDIPQNRILAAAARVENGRVTSQLIRLPSGEGKARLIREVVKQTPDAAFGNSRWDIAMLSMARHAFAVNPNPDLHELAEERGWPVYWPDALGKDALEK